MIGEFMLQIMAALEAYGIPYMLTGSLASSMYGVPRATNNIDIVIAPTPSQLSSLIQFCTRLGLYVPPFEEALESLRRVRASTRRRRWNFSDSGQQARQLRTLKNGFVCFKSRISGWRFANARAPSNCGRLVAMLLYGSGLRLLEGLHRRFAPENSPKSVHLPHRTHNSRPWE